MLPRARPKHAVSSCSVRARQGAKNLMSATSPVVALSQVALVSSLVLVQAATSPRRAKKVFIVAESGQRGQSAQRRVHVDSALSRSGVDARRLMSALRVSQRPDTSAQSPVPSLPLVVERRKCKLLMRQPGITTQARGLLASPALLWEVPLPRGESHLTRDLKSERCFTPVLRAPSRKQKSLRHIRGLKKTASPTITRSPWRNAAERDVSATLPDCLELILEGMNLMATAKTVAADSDEKLRALIEEQRASKN
jgi:hypothetical protein